MTEKRTRFSIGYPSDFVFGVSTKYQQEHRIWVVRDSTRLYVILAKCTHLGCTVAWNGTSGQVECPCHGARYNLHGEVLNGPAREPLTVVSLTVEAHGIRVRALLEG